MRQTKIKRVFAQLILLTLFILAPQSASSAWGCDDNRTPGFPLPICDSLRVQRGYEEGVLHGGVFFRPDRGLSAPSVNLPEIPATHQLQVAAVHAKRPVARQSPLRVTAKMR